MATLQPLSEPAQRARLRKQMLALATVLLVGGVAVLAFLTRIPLPLRIAVGITDLIASAVLFLVVRQKFPATPPGGTAGN
ncbi:MAG: hypothetical protein NTV51_25240 [Verrucomicrobia bacterium]|nr:hypothetical protein [Verrucomicrobiota bacterium]